MPVPDESGQSGVTALVLFAAFLVAGTIAILVFVPRVEKRYRDDSPQPIVTTTCVTIFQEGVCA
jgi:hypothetical protein